MKLKSLRKALLLGFIALCIMQCKSTEDNWESANDALIEKYDLTEFDLSEIPVTGITSNFSPGKVESLTGKQEVELQPGVNAKIMYGSGSMIAVIHVDAGVSLAEETLPSDRFLFVLEGGLELSNGDETLTLTSKEREEPDGTHGGTPVLPLTYQEKGAKTSYTAGETGATLLEVYSPVRLDYLKKLGIENLPTEMPPLHDLIAANLETGVVYNLYDIQPVRVSDAISSRILSGRNMQLGFTSIDPLTELKPVNDPVEKLALALRGGGKVMTLGQEMEIGPEDAIYLPPGMVHGVKVDSIGFDVLEVLWPATSRVAELNQHALNTFHEIIPEGATPELLIDGSKSKPTLTFTEGPKWMNGKVYFSNMFFDQGFGASPQKSSTVEMDVNGNYRNITQGQMQTNGLYPYKNGNLIVCDMMGHRVVEMTTGGKVVKVLADSYNGKPIDGPNDVITDAKGGFYFTDPQFTMEPEKFQPGRAVYYVNPEGEVKRITEPNEFAMPNGILLSQDGKTLFINNCYDDEDWFPVKSEKDNFLWAYDVNEDGSISNGRKFAKLLLPDAVLDRKGKSSSADGMAMDTDGNIYVATYLGVQIFDKSGKFIGIINLPTFPVSLCFGGEDMKTLFIVSFDKVYKMPTKKVGYVNYL